MSRGSASTKKKDACVRGLMYRKSLRRQQSLPCGCFKTSHLPTFATLISLGSLGRSSAPLRRSARPKTPHLPTFLIFSIPSAPLGLGTWPLDPAWLRWGARHGRSNSLGSDCSAWLIENTAPADVFECGPARFRCSARHWRSSLLDSAGALRNAGLWGPHLCSSRRGVFWYFRHGKSLL